MKKRPSGLFFIGAAIASKLAPTRSTVGATGAAFRLAGDGAKPYGNTGKKTARPLPLCHSPAEMPCRFSGIAAAGLAKSPGNTGFFDLARRLLSQCYESQDNR
ncbi:hypothetical protein TRP66_15695 [Pseudomonas sp. JDS28PS106]|uniref:hypothetical protein n=1 Tax=Pseudomonas sp. JDS28PS106 TaxID=2497235 RepID=UPI002FD1A814